MRIAQLVRRAALPAALASVLCAPTGTGAEDRSDLTALPLEQLLNVEITTASKFTQRASEAPSAVTVLTRSDIANHGYRTLAEILNGIRGIYTHYDRNYSYAGVRGIARPGDYNTRLLLLVDGYRMNDGVYDQAPVGTEFPLDIDLIERIEFVPGPGSAIYGSNALFGVINVITRGGEAVRGAEVSAEYASFDAVRGRATLGRVLDNGAQFLLSATGFNSDGDDLLFPEFADPATGNGVALGLDHDRARQAFAKFTYGAWTLEGLWGERIKGIPTASYGQVFGDPRSETADRQGFVNLKHYGPVADGLELGASAYYGTYDYNGAYVYDSPPVTVNADGSRSRWWGGEARVLVTRFNGHKLLAGAEYRDDYKRRQFNYDQDPFALYYDEDRPKTAWGVYVQDEARVGEDWILTLGVRHDDSSESRSETNPRAAVIYSGLPRTTVKALYGTAFRAPNAYEKYYNDGGSSQKGNPALQAEEIRTQELVVEYQPHTDFRAVGSVYAYRIDQLIQLTTDPADGLLVFTNLGRANVRGLELEAERAFGAGIRVRGSVAFQEAEDDVTGARLSNSPRRLAKLHATAPLLGEALRAGLEVQYVGPRPTYAGAEVSGYTLVNLTLRAPDVVRDLELSASLYNLFDKAHAHPPSDEHFDALGRVLSGIPQDGRTFRLKLTYRY